jgi:Putative MetA-pathway of phenol degradation
MKRAGAVLGLAALLLASGAANARVVKAKRTAKVAHEVVIGSRFELEDHEYELPVLLEWSPNKRLELSAEYAYARIDLDSGERVGGFKDLDLGAVYELLPARRERPGLALSLDVKVPTAGNRDFGTGKPDFGIGFVLTREYVHFEAQVAASYTFVGSPKNDPLTNGYELSASVEWHPTTRVDIFGEVVASHGGSTGFGVGGTSPANTPGSNTETEFTVGIAEHLGPHFKLEQGVSHATTTSILYIVGWEYDFGFGN